MKHPNINDEAYESMKLENTKLRAENDLMKKFEEERRVSNELYAKILVEKIVYWFIVLICTAVFGAILTLVIKK